MRSRWKITCRGASRTGRNASMAIRGTITIRRDEPASAGTSPPKWSRMRLSLVAAVLLGGGPSVHWAQSTPVAPDSAAPSAIVSAGTDWDRWVDELGASSFARREYATRVLLSAKLDALGSLERARQRPDREISARAGLIMVEVLRRERAQRIDRFVGGDTTLDRYPLPGWRVLQAAAGDSPASRRYLAEILSTEWEFLEAWENPVGGPPRRDPVLFGGRRAAASSRSNSTAHCAAVLLAALNDPATIQADTQSLARIYRLVTLPSTGADEAEAMWRHAVFRRIAAEFFLATADGRLGPMALQLAARHELPELSRIAVAVLRAPNVTPPTVQATLLLLGRHGDASHVRILEAYLDDESVCHTNRRENAEGFETRVQDAALLAIWQLSGRKPEQLGMSRLLPSPVFGFAPHTVGFDSQAARDAARQRLREMLGTR